MKTGNEIIRQSKSIMARIDKSSPDYSGRLHRIAEIGRAYLHNIARQYSKPYGRETWAKIGDNKVTRKCYAGY